MGALQPMHLAVILVIVLIVFGPGKLTQLSGQLGKGIREFRDSSEGKAADPAPPASARPFCAQCGAQRSEGRFCDSCGAEVAAA